MKTVLFVVLMGVIAACDDLPDVECEQGMCNCQCTYTQDQDHDCTVSVTIDTTQGDAGLDSGVMDSGI